MKVLVLGGTQFVGRAIVEALVAQNHEVSLIHRGKTGADLFTNCKHFLADRNESLGGAESTDWDAVIDVSCYLPKQARLTADLKTNRYIFISTISTYNMEDLEGPLTEETPLLPAEEGEEVTPASYGPLKVRCEEILAEAFGEKLSILRPGIIFGPYDPTGRYPYWVSRILQYETILVPDLLDLRMQWIDVRDLANFTVGQLNETQAAIYNLVGPRAPFQELLDELIKQVGETRNLLIVEADKLEAKEVKLWIDLPIFYRPDKGNTTFNFDPAKAVSAGLTLRSLEETTRGTLDWLKANPESAKGKYGMTREREEQLIAEFVEENS